MTIMKHWLVFSVFMVILVSFLASQIEAKKSKPKRCVGPDGKIYKWKDVLDVDECYQKKCTKKRKWRLKLKKEKCCKYKKTVLPNLSRKEIDGVMFLCFNGNLKEIPSNEMPVNMTISQGNESASNKTVRTARIVPLELQHFEIFEDKRAVFQFSNDEKAFVKLEKDDDGCIYTGAFRQEMDSRVLVTGCQGEENSIQIQSLMYGDILATVVNGSVVLPKDIELTRITNSLKPHVDYIENPDYLKQFPNRSNVNRNVNLPSVLALPVRVYMSPSWRNKFGGFDGGRRKAKEILYHVKYWFLHRTLRTKMYVLTVDEEFFATHLEYTATDANYNALGSGVKAPASGHAAIVYLTATTLGGCGLGITQVKTICSSIKVMARSINKWHTSDLYTAQTVAHEIGHNLGYYHDFDKKAHRPWTCGPGKSNNGPNNDLMNYAGRCGELVQNKWSDCSNQDFKNYFSAFSKFCLETTQGTFSPKCVTSPGYPNNYPDNHNGENGALLPISVWERYGIEITFHDFDVEDHSNCAYDYVQIYDGNGNTKGPKLCGSSLPQKITIESTSSAAVYFKSDSSVRKRGFKLCYERAKWESCANIYEHCNYGGDHLQMRDGDAFYALAHEMYAYLGQWNDRISSFWVRSGCTLYYGRHHWFGDSRKTTGSDSCLVDNGFNDEISSLYCECS